MWVLWTLQKKRCVSWACYYHLILISFLLKPCFPLQCKTWLLLKTYLCSWCSFCALHPTPTVLCIRQFSGFCLMEGFPGPVGSRAPLWGWWEQLLLRPVRSRGVVHWDRNLKLENLEGLDTVSQCDSLSWIHCLGRGPGPSLFRRKYQSNNGLRVGCGYFLLFRKGMGWLRIFEGTLSWLLDILLDIRALNHPNEHT